jgi:hypothetical protein
MFASPTEGHQAFAQRLRACGLEVEDIEDGGPTVREDDLNVDAMLDV